MKNLDFNQIKIFINLEIIGEEKFYIYIYIYIKIDIYILNLKLKNLISFEYFIWFQREKTLVFTLT